MKILIVRFTSLGDLVTLEPTFRLIRHFFQEAEITFLTSGIGKGLYSDTDYFDRFIIHRGFAETIGSLRTDTFDLVINLQCNKPSHLLVAFSKKKRIVNKSYTLWQSLLRLRAHSKRLPELLEACGVVHEKVEAYFEATPRPFITLPVGQSDIDIGSDGRPLVAISTGSSERWLSKRWGVERFVALVGKLLASKCEVVLVGTALELDDAQQICDSFPGRIKSFVDKTSLTELKFVLSKVDLFIGNDSGPAHIAAAVGTNTVTIFGSTSEAHCVKRMPYRGNHQCLTPLETIRCHPCYKPKCPTQMECMSSIEIDRVYSVAMQLLKSEQSDG